MVQTIVKATTKQVTENITYEEFLQKYMDVHVEWIGAGLFSSMLL